MKANENFNSEGPDVILADDAMQQPQALAAVAQYTEPDHFGRPNGRVMEFLDKNSQAFIEYNAHQDRLLAVGQQFHSLKLRVEDQKLLLQRVRDEVAFTKRGPSVGQLIADTFASEQVSVSSAAVKINVLSAMLVEKFGDDVIKAQEGKLKAEEKNLSDFIATEKEILAELQIL